MTTTSKMWLAAFASLVFATGALTGVLVDRRWRAAAGAELPGGPAVFDGPGPRGRAAGAAPADVVEVTLNRLTRVLALGDDQRTRMRDILERREARIRTAQAQARQQFVDEQQTLQQEIDAVLTPDQRERFQAMRGRLLGPAGGRGPFGRGPGRPGFGNGRPGRE